MHKIRSRDTCNSSSWVLDSLLLSCTHIFVQKLTKNALNGRMTSWFGLVKLLSYNTESALGDMGSIVLYGITEILLKVTFSTNKTDYHGLTEILLKVAFKANKTYHHIWNKGLSWSWSWSWSYGSWIYNYMQSLPITIVHSLKRFPLLNHIIHEVYYIGTSTCLIGYLPMCDTWPCLLWVASNEIVPFPEYIVTLT